MTRKSRRILSTGLLAMTLSVLTTGCALPYFILGVFGKEDLVQPAVQLCEGRKDVKRLLVLTYASSKLRFEFDAVDDDLSKVLGRMLETRESRFEVVPDRKVRAWRDMNPNWADADLAEIGAQFDVDHVVFVEILDFTLNETKNQYLLKGNCGIQLKIYDVERDEEILKDFYERDYPPHRELQLTEVSSEYAFRNRFLRRIAEELSWYLTPHRRTDELSDL